MVVSRPIILIDDDIEDLELLCEVVRGMKYDNPVISFTDSVKALAYFKENKVTAFFIICDLNMPKVNGLQLRRDMIEYDGYDKETHFYLLSTGNTSKDRELASQLNITDYLIKPTSFSGIKKVLETIFSKAIHAYGK